MNVYGEAASLKSNGGPGIAVALSEMCIEVWSIDMRLLAVPGTKPIHIIYRYCTIHVQARTRRRSLDIHHEVRVGPRVKIIERSGSYNRALSWVWIGLSSFTGIWPESWRQS